MQDVIERRFTPASEAEQRFWEKVQVGPGCWVWCGRTDAKGYGTFDVARSKIARAHRLSWIFAHGAPPPGACVLQRCGRRDCVNPEHLYLGRALERRKPARRRVAPRRSPGAVPDEKARLIRRLHATGVPPGELARRFALAGPLLLRIVHGR